jgi:hypothetical protein
LGILSPEGITTNPEKLKVVQEWPTLKNKHEIRSFLVLCTYYRWFIPGLTDIAKPLTKLIEQKQSFQWTPHVEAIFQMPKGLLCAAPILAYPQQEETFNVDTDTSNVGNGGVFSQVQVGQEQVKAYYSKMLNKAEKNYCVTQRELLAIVRTLEHFHKYLYKQEFHLRTDHSALMWLLSFKNPEGQTRCCIWRLQEYKFTSEHHQGRKHDNDNDNANALS